MRPRLSSRSAALLCGCVASCALTLAAVNDPLADAKRAFAAGSYADAIRLLKDAPVGSDACEISFILGVAEYRLRQLPAALIDLQSAAQCQPGRAETRIALAEAFAQNGDDNHALLSYEAALQIDPAQSAALRASAELYLRHDLNKQASEKLERLATLEPADARVWSNLGAAYAGQGNFEQARRSFEQALRLQPANPDALVGLGHIELKSGAAESALPVLSEAIRIAPRAYEAYFLRGSALNSLGRYGEAIPDFETATKLGATDREIYYQMARAYRALGRDREARQALERFSALQSRAGDQEESRREAARLVVRAKTLVGERKLSEAITLLEKSRQLAGDSPLLLFRLAGLYFDTHQYTPARDNVRSAIAMAPSEWSYHYLLGLIEQASNNWEQARQSLETATRLNPAAADAFNQLGNVALNTRRFDDAVRSFQQAVRLSPGQPAYQANLETAQRLAQH